MGISKELRRLNQNIERLIAIYEKSLTAPNEDTRSILEFVRLLKRVAERKLQKPSGIEELKKRGPDSE